MKKIESELIFEIASKFKKTDGVVTKTKNLQHGIKRMHTQILTGTASKKFERDVGNYVSFVFDELLFFDAVAKNMLSIFLSKEIKRLLKIHKISPEKVLIVGLGNEKYACDRLGKGVASRVLVTKPYLEKKLFTKKQMNEIYAFSPGVYGTTGLESGATIKSVCNLISPNLVVAVDSLVASKTSTLAKSIQLSDTKLSPGGGVGNNRLEISQNTLSVPVFTIGFPTVTNLQKYSENEEDLIVTPKDIEAKCSDISKIIARAINISFCNLTSDELFELTS